MSINFPLNQDITRIDPAFQILSDMGLVDTYDFPMDATLKASGWVDGNTVCTNTLGNLIITDNSTPVKNSFFVFDGSRLASDVPYDTVASEVLTVITSGGWLGKTQLFTGTPAVGTLLVGLGGVLAAAGAGQNHLAIAVVTQPISAGYLYFRAL